MELNYRKASLSDLELLIKTRTEVLRAANQLDDTADMATVEENSRDYYRCSLADGSHIAYLVSDGERLAGTGGISFFRVMPTWHNPTGTKAYIMNMYTSPEYRRIGIAYRTLNLLVLAAREHGPVRISLEATDMGRPLYEKYGFIHMNHEMELPEDWSGGA